MIVVERFYFYTRDDLDDHLSWVWTAFLNWEVWLLPIEIMLHGCL